MKKTTLVVIMFIVVLLGLIAIFYQRENKPEAVQNISESLPAEPLDQSHCFDDLIKIENCELSFKLFKDRQNNCENAEFTATDKLDDIDDMPITFYSTLTKIASCFESKGDWKNSQEVWKFGLDQIQSGESRIAEAKYLQYQFEVGYERSQLPTGECKNVQDFEAALKTLALNKSLDPLRAFLSRDTSILMGHTESDNIGETSFSKLQLFFKNALPNSDLKFGGPSSRVTLGPTYIVSGWKNFESPNVYFTYQLNEKCVHLSGVFYEYNAQ